MLISLYHKYTTGKEKQHIELMNSCPKMLTLLNANSMKFVYVTETSYNEQN